MCLIPYANNKGADQAAHPRSLISTFVVRCLDRVICILAISKVSRFWLASVAEQAGLNVTWSKIPEDTFSNDVAQMKTILHPSRIKIVIFRINQNCQKTVCVPFKNFTLRSSAYTLYF